MNEPMRICLVEDEPVSAGITLRMLGEAGLGGAVTKAATLNEGLSAIRAERPAVVLLDLALPDSSGIDTVNAVCGAYPVLPVIVMTGTDDEANGIEALKHGAQDYLVKGQFDDRVLKKALHYAIERQDLLNEKAKLILKLQEALKHVKVLTGLLPTCADCKKIRTPKGEWVQMESYISERSDATFTHGFCDTCFKKRMKEMG